MKKISFFVLVTAIISMTGLYAASHIKSTKKLVSSVDKKTSYSLKKHVNINVNTANSDTLMSLKGLGAQKAKAIVAYRKKHGKFKSVDDIAKVRGIGDKLLAKIRKNNTEKITAK